MAVKQISVTRGGNIKEYTGLTADTAAFLVDPEYIAKSGNGSTYRELDGTFRLYELQSDVWYLQGQV